MLKLYILPIECYEEHLKSDFNLFKRDNFFYQYEDNLFIFYSWDKSVVMFPTDIKGFSPEITEYSIHKKFDPRLSPIFINHYMTIRQYLRAGIEIKTKIFAPPNDFIRDSLLYICNRFGIQEVELAEITNFSIQDQYFFDEVKGDMTYTDIYPSLYYMYFLTYLNHVLRQIYNKTTNRESGTIFNLLLSRYYNGYVGANTTAVKTRYVDTKMFSIGYQLRDPIFEQHDDGIVYPCRTWKNRAIPEIYDECSVFKFDKGYYIQNEVIDYTEVASREYCEPTSGELFYRFEKLLPQAEIAYNISKADRYIDENGIIEAFPDFGYIPDDFEITLLNLKNEIELKMDEKEIFDIIELTISKIISNIKVNIRENVKYLGVCPACGKLGVIKGSNLFCCIYCDNFKIWNKTIEKKLGFVMTKQQMSKLLRPNSQYVTKIKNTEVRLYSRENRLSEGREDITMRFWDLEVANQ